MLIACDVMNVGLATVFDGQGLPLLALLAAIATPGVMVKQVGPRSHTFVLFENFIRKMAELMLLKRQRLDCDSFCFPQCCGAWRM